MSGTTTALRRRRRACAPALVWLAIASAACGTTVSGAQSQTAGAATTSGLAGGPAAGAISGAAVGGGQETGAAGSGGALALGSSTSDGAGAAGPGATAAGDGAGPGAPGAVDGSAGSTGPAVTGRGFTKTTVYIGFTTQNDATQAFAGAGLNGLDYGSFEGDANAIAADLNAHGGLLGRKVVPLFHDHKTGSLVADAAAEGQADCTDFTQDRPVIAVVNLVALLDTPSYQQCLAKNGVPFVTGTIRQVDAAQEHQLAPYFHSVASATWDAVVPVWLDRLTAMHYFTGWNTATGAPGPAPVKVALLHQDVEPGPRGFALVRKALAARGIDVAMEASYSGTDASKQQQDMAGFVLQFKAKGITHVLSDTTPVQYFMQVAEQQGYRPRYGLTSLHRLAYSLQGNASKAQLTGSLAIGWLPPSDVTTGADIGKGSKRCNAAMQRGQQSFKDVAARIVGYAACDGAYLVADMARAGGGLTSRALIDGFPKAGPGFLSALSLGGGFGNHLSQGGIVRDVAYNASCSCFAYADSGTYRLG